MSMTAFDTSFIAAGQGQPAAGFATVPGTGFVQGAVAGGTTAGVWAYVDTGQGLAGLELNANTTYSEVTGVLGYGDDATGVAGVSNAGVGVYGQTGVALGPSGL